MRRALLLAGIAVAVPFIPAGAEAPEPPPMTSHTDPFPPSATTTTTVEPAVVERLPVTS